jgi:short subunit dehydrogenase-like uncharacterized protein
MSKSYDLVLWGATGFTGRLTAEYLTRRYGVAGAPLRWAIAGRDQTKLEAIRDELAEIDPTAVDIPILLGDSHDRPSLDAIVAQTRVVCTTVGPYTLHGAPLVAACAAGGVAYCDLTGEPPWIRDNIERFGPEAAASGARIVHACGYDSIPSDLGTLMVQEQAMADHGRYAPTVKNLFGPMRGGISGGTAASMLLLAKQSSRSRRVRRLLADPYALAPDVAVQQKRPPTQTTARYDPDFGRWTAPFFMEATNSRIVYRSHALQEYRYGRSFRYQEVMRMGTGLGGQIGANAFTLGVGLFLEAAKLGLTRRLLENSILPAPGEGPDRESRENGFFRTTLLAKLPATNGAEAAWVRGKVVGVNDPGYGETAKMLAESALCLALDEAELPERSGILTPATAMGTRLIERLRAAGMTFTAETVPVGSEI